MLLNLLLRIRRPISMAIHATLIVVANIGAFWLRFDGRIPPEYWQAALSSVPWILAVRMLVFWPLHLFEGLWKYTSILDLRNIILGVGVSTAVLYPLEALTSNGPGYPRSILLIDSLLLVSLLGGARMSRRVYRELRLPRNGRRLLIYGAGDAAEMILRDLRQSTNFDAQPVGLVDDDPMKMGRRIQGVRVLGGREHLAAIIGDTRAEEILIAIPSASTSSLNAIVRSLEPYKIRISTLPKLADLIGRRVGAGQIRQLKIEDLLGREPVALDHESIRGFLAGKRVMVTGAGGSIGSELSRQIAIAGPESLLLLDHYENSLFQIHNELLDKTPALAIHPVVANITDAPRIGQIVASFRPSVIFHAAAHKHVPLMEHNPCEAIKNNVRGTRVVAEAARQSGVERFVMVSTDKAANPTSVMGSAKRVAELVVRAMNATGQTKFIVVRFGNVLGSNGSVVPRFVAQIAAGGPVTVTHPEMRRFFMLIPEAVQLVLHAGALADQGAIFVLDMGEQVRVVDLARNLIRLSGLIPDQEIEITYTGIRPGEKLEEELVGTGETVVGSHIEKVMRVEDSGGSQPAHDLAAWVASIESAAVSGDEDNVIRLLAEVFPTFRPTATAKPTDAGFHAVRGSN
jgi:FlaA1/EpsC-like NDP-sugar epimerase